MDSYAALLSISDTANDFNFDSGCSTPYISAPSSPARIPNLFNSDTQFCCKFRHLPSFKEPDVKQGMSKETERSGVGDDGDEFAFDFSGNSEGYESVFAEELFDGGKIKPLQSELKVKPVKTEIFFNRNPKMSPEHRSSSSHQSSRITQSSGEDDGRPAPENTTTTTRRSLSLVHETVSFWDMFPFSKQYRKWNLKSLLFRSASEGRNDVVAMRSSTTASIRRGMETQNDAVAMPSFRSNESSGSGSNRRRKGARSVSAHELHYKLNRAALEELKLKRRTFLPYKQGLLGCFGYGQPTDVVSRVGSLTRG